MPWCPNCKTEYREGITHCADCKVELVANLNEVKTKNATALIVKVEASQAAFAKKLLDFLKYSGVTAVVLNEGDMLGIYTTPEEFKNARRHFKAFYSVESEMIMQKAAEAAFLAGEEYEDYSEAEDAEESDDSEEASVSAPKTASSSLSKDEKIHTSAASRYEDYHSSGVTFTVLGVLGITFALLNFFGVIPFFASPFVSVIILLMFVVFLALGVFSFAKSGKLKEGAVLEEQLVAEAKKWLNENISDEMLQAFDKEAPEDSEKSAELLYLDRLDKLQEALLAAFPSLNASLAEQLIEEFYTQKFE